MNDPKYKIVDGKLWSIAGDYPVPDDEPIMILRGKDPIAQYAIAAYIVSHCDESHRASASERQVAFARFREANPDRVGTDCTKGR